jgi:hypothetical protein
MFNRRHLLGAAATLPFARHACAQAKTEITLSCQPGILYLSIAHDLPGS